MKNFILGLLTGLVLLGSYCVYEVKSNQLILTGVPVQLEQGYSESERDSFTALLDNHK